MPHDSEPSDNLLNTRQGNIHLPDQAELKKWGMRFFDFNRNVAKADGIYRLHTHVKYEMIVVEDGEYVCYVDGADLHLNVGEILIIQPGQQHKDILRKGTTYYAFHFQFEPFREDALPQRLFAVGTPPREQVVSPQDIASLHQLIALMEQVDARGSSLAFSWQLCNALFAGVFLMVVSQYPQTVLHQEFTRQFQGQRADDRLYAIFSDHLQDMPTLDTLCKAASLSKSALHRLCIQRFNRPPRQAFLWFKIRQIDQYMQLHPEKNLKQISELFGFSNQFHFSRVFRKYMNFYPSYRRAVPRNG